MHIATNALSGEAALSTTVISAPSARALATGVAVAAAVALPQVAHVFGAAVGLGPAVGQVLLPMFLPVMAVGLLAGPAAGLVAGVVAPVLSSLLTGMPVAPMPLFAMVPEVAVLGLVCGALSTRRLPWVAKVLVAQLAGLAAYAVAAGLFAAVATGFDGQALLGTVANVARVALPGYAIQWVALPALMAVVTRAESARSGH